MAGSHTGHRTYRRNRGRLKTPDAICASCGNPIDITLPARHPMSFTADHDTPYSQGGTHAITNLRPMHLICNQRKGAGALEPERHAVIPW